MCTTCDELYQRWIMTRYMTLNSCVELEVSRYVSGYANLRVGK